MSEDFVRDVLREHAEAGMPTGKDPWPEIKERVLAASAEHTTTALSTPVVADPGRPKVASPHKGPTGTFTGTRRFRVSMATAMVGLLAFVAGGFALLTWNGPQPNPGTELAPGCWGLVSSPNIEGGDTVLIALSAISANDVWAAGYSNRGGVAQTLVQRWNGQQWSIVPSANIPSQSNYLTGIAALAPNDVWSVGYHCQDNCVDDPAPLIQHWDGKAWSILPTPAMGRLNGIAAVSDDDIWTVGYRGSQPLSMHWNGKQWSEVPTNNPPLGNRSVQLKAVASLSSNDVWAVGEEYDPAANRYSGAIYHWDGTLWRHIPDTEGPGGDRLSAIAATSPDDIWAVGEKGNSAVSDQHLQTITKRWDGARWLEVPSPNVGTGDSYLKGVAAISPTDAWAVGGYGPRTGTKQTLVLHWDGAVWSVVPSPNVERQSNRFFGVEAISASEIWAVGTYNRTGTGAFVERYDNPCTLVKPLMSVPLVPDIRDPTAIPGFDAEHQIR